MPVSSNVYIKIRFDEDGMGIKRFIISEDKDKVEKWLYKPLKKRKISKRKDRNIEENVFSKILSEFQASINTNYYSIPFLMSFGGAYKAYSDLNEISGYVKENSTLICREKLYETYEMPIDRIGMFQRKLDNLSAIGRGLSSLPKLFLLGLVGSYDAFLAKLIGAILLEKPGIISSSERNISFKELVEFQTVDMAREYIIEKEVESQLRKSHDDQLKWLEHTLNMKLTVDLDIFPEFIELCERRNILTHSDGIVSSQYLKVCREHGVILDSDMVLNKEIKVSKIYYMRSVEVVNELGFKLLQVIWRKLRPYENEVADLQLNSICYDLIVSQRYKLASSMLKFGLYGMKKIDRKESDRMMMVINYANAEKLGGNYDLAIEILDKEDWSAAKENYIICVYAIKNDINKVISLMKRVVDLGLMQLSHFREWPVFEKLRSEASFISAFEQTFNSKLFLDSETVIKNPDSILP